MPQRRQFVHTSFPIPRKSILLATVTLRNTGNDDFTGNVLGLSEKLGIPIEPVQYL
jgi:hypothetical protein